MLVHLVLGGHLLLDLSLLAMVELLNSCLAGSLLHLPFECRVVMVLNMVVGSSLEVLGDLRPAVAVDLVVLEYLVVLFNGPLHLLDVRVEMVVPPIKVKNRLVVLIE